MSPWLVVHTFVKMCTFLSISSPSERHCPDHLPTGPSLSSPSLAHQALSGPLHLLFPLPQCSTPEIHKPPSFGYFTQITSCLMRSSLPHFPAPVFALFFSLARICFTYLPTLFYILPLEYKPREGREFSPLHP